MTIPLIRKRAKRPKTHTGCITCRARHIKCDEAKPGCMRCAKSRRECEGYTEVRGGGGDGSSSASARRRLVPAFVLPKPPPTTISPSNPGCYDGSSSSSDGSGNDIADFGICCNSSDGDDLWTFPFSPSLSSFAFSPFLLSSPSLFPSLSAQELSSLEFFRLKTAHELPGSRWSLGWPELALKVAMDGSVAGGGASSTAVTHVAIALGAMHRAAGGGHVDGDGSMKEFALKQYGLAMAGLRDHIEGMEVGGRKKEKGVETVLLVSLLFFCFEVWNGDDVRAGFHLRTGLRILGEWHGSTKTIEGEQSGKRSPIVIEAAPGDDMRLLTRTFVRLDGDLSIVSKGDPCLRAVVKGDIPEVFASVDEAMVHLDALTTSGVDIWGALADVTVVELEREGIRMDTTMMSCLASARSRSVNLDRHPRLLERIRDHCESVRRCMKALAFVPVKDGEETAHLLVQIHLFVLWFDSCTWREVSEMFADAFEAQFEHIIGLAERYVDLHRTGYGVRPAISIGTGLVAGICVIAFHCRVSSIRRRCIDLLKRVNLQGVFDADYLVAFVEAYIGVEESRAREILGRDEHDDSDLSPHDIPFEARVLDMELGGRLDGSDDPFYKDDVGQLVYARANSQGIIGVDSVYFLVNR